VEKYDPIAHALLLDDLLHYFDKEHWGKKHTEPLQMAVENSVDISTRIRVITPEQKDSFLALFSEKTTWDDVRIMASGVYFEARDAIDNGEAKDYWEKPNQAVDDILAFQSLFSTMVDTNSAKMDKREDSPKTTPLQNAKSFQRVHSDFITHEQKEKFAAQFSEDTTWADVWKMSRENDKQVKEAYENNKILIDWPSDILEKKGR